MTHDALRKRVTKLQTSFSATFISLDAFHDTESFYLPTSFNSHCAKRKTSFRIPLTSQFEFYGYLPKWRFHYYAYWFFVSFGFAPHKFQVWCQSINDFDISKTGEIRWKFYVGIFYDNNNLLTLVTNKLFVSVHFHYEFRDAERRFLSLLIYRFQENLMRIFFFFLLRNLNLKQLLVH